MKIFGQILKYSTITLYLAGALLHAGECELPLYKAELLYWKTNSDKALLTISQNNVLAGANVGAIVDAKQTGLSEKWRPGARLTVSLPAPFCADWQLDVRGTWYNGQSTAHDEINREPITGALSSSTSIVSPLFPSLINQLAQVKSGSVKTKVDFDFHEIDATLAKIWTCCDCLRFKPFLGLVGYHIEDKLHSRFEGINDVITNLQYSDVNHTNANYWAGGGRMGLYADWEVDCGLRLYGSGSFNYVFGRYELHRTLKTNFIPLNAAVQAGIHPTVTKSNTSHWQSRLIGEAMIGVLWNCCLDNHYFEFNAAWEWQMLFKQQRTISTQASNVTLQGFTGGVAICF